MKYKEMSPRKGVQRGARKKKMRVRHFREKTDRSKSYIFV
jgi:hypothetical protein